ncbi:MAG: hypothetical protein HY904_09040 [Deltaproteobacteria bacterium]|nr:hypothetical protein [Deltaproteobacteria bacterium]
MSLSRVLVAALLLGGALPGAAAPPAPRLVRTRMILKAITQSFVGEPTRAELLQGGLAGLMRLAPGTSFAVDKAARVSCTRGKVTLRFDTEAMLSETEVAGALEKCAAAVGATRDVPLVDDAVAAGVVQALADRHSGYIRPFYMERLGYSEGEMLGDVGLEVTLSGSNYLIKSVQPGSAAAAAGIKPMQLLRRVDHHAVDGLSLGEVGALLLGPTGSSVELVVEPRGGDGVNAISIRRDPPFALQPHVKELKDALYIVPGPILGNSAKLVREALLKHPGNRRGIILDFRGNAGGQVGDAVAMADLFVEEGALAQVVSRASRPVQRFEARPGDPGEKLPLVVLVDGRSASAAELVALVLRERRKAPLLGTVTYGKGSVQKLIPIDGGGYLKITSAMYMTPAGTTVGEGIVPDVALDPDKIAQRGKEGDLGTDPWLQAAYDALAAPGDAGP